MIMFFKNKKDNNERKTFYIFKVLFIIIVIIGIYLILNFVKIFNKNNVKIYEVSTGEIVNVDRHKGFIYRDESVITCVDSGYINFFVTKSDKVKRGAFIYTINDNIDTFEAFDLNDNDKNLIKQNIKKFNNNISNIDFQNIYTSKDSLNNLIGDLNKAKQLENINFESEFDAKEKGYAKYSGLISFFIDDLENSKIEEFNDSLIKNYDNIGLHQQKKKVVAGDKVYRIVKNPEFNIAFDSSYDYDANSELNNVNVKFLYENVTTSGHIDSFTGTDGKKHFRLSIIEHPELFIDKRVVEFEIENKKINGYKIPIKSIVSKNCYIIPKTMMEIDLETNESYFYKVLPNGERQKFTCNISKEDEKYYYISIDDTFSKLKYGDVLANRYNDTFSISEVKKLDGVYNMNKGYAIFKNIDVIDRTNEYAIISKKTANSIALYDHIALDASEINEGDLIS